MSYGTIEIQKQLAAKGYDPGPIDGIRGRRTILAIRQFQADKSLIVDGIVGPATREKLFAGAATMPNTLGADRPWYEEARRLMGTKEVSGSGSNKVIEDWASDLGIPYATDDIPWCGLFVAHCIGSTLLDEDLPSSPLTARGWQLFGKACKPSLGAILIYWRKSYASGLGHVGFYAGEDEKAFYTLGGNQSDAVNIKRVAKTQFLEARWPKNAFYGEPERVALDLGTSAFETRLS